MMNDYPQKPEPKAGAYTQDLRVALRSIAEAIVYYGEVQIYTKEQQIKADKELAVLEARLEAERDQRIFSNDMELEKFRQSGL